MEKGDRTIAQYLGRVQQIVDILESIGDPVSHRDQLEAIVDGLPPEYHALASIIQYCDQPCEPVAETMLLSREARVDRAPRSSSLESLTVNLTQGNLTQSSQPTIANSPDSASSLSSHESQPQFDASRNNHGCRSFNTRGGGRNGGRSRVQCQICSKTGHDAKVCYYRLSVQQPSPNEWHNPVIAQQPPSNFVNPWQHSIPQQQFSN